MHVFTTNVDGQADSNVPLGVPVDMDGVKVWYFPVPFLRRLYWSPRLGQALQLQMRSFDIVHTHSVFLWPTWAAARAATRQGAPYVVAPRGMLVPELIRRKSRLLKTAWLRLIERGNLEGAAAIHVTSRIEGDDLAGFNLRLPPVRIVPNGVDAAPVDADSGDASAEVAAVTAGPRYLLFIGRINWKKGLDRLIPAMAQLEGIHLVIAGNDEEAYQPVLEALARRHGVEQRVRFIGPVYGADKLALLRDATALVLPSYSENFGNVVLEAMAAGCPVVVTREMGVADIVRESGAGIVVDGAPDALAAGIAQLLSAPDLLEEMSLNGSATVARQYGWDTVAQQLEAVYRACLTG